MAMLKSMLRRQVAAATVIALEWRQFSTAYGMATGK